MKIKLRESQYNRLKELITETSQPVSLKSLFNDNPNAKFFNVIQKLKGGSQTSYDFEILNVNGHKSVKDINGGGTSKGCVIDFKPETLIYGNQFKLNFGSCGVRTINNVISVNLFKSLNDLKQNNTLDSQEIEGSVDPNISIIEYYNALKSLEVGDKLFLESKGSYVGVILNKNGNNIEIEVSVRSNQQPYILNVNLSNNPFIIDNNQVFFNCSGFLRGESNIRRFKILVKSFDVEIKPNTTQTSTSREPNDVHDDDDELIKKGKMAYDIILNDKDLRTAFYKAPSFMNLLMAELKGEKAPGSGILPTLQIVGEKKRMEVLDKLGSEFIIDKRIFFEAYHKDIIINYDHHVFKMGVGTKDKRSAFVREYALGDEFIILENKQNKFRVNIKNKTDVQDVFKCDLIKYIDKADKGIEEFTANDVYIRILREGDGYFPIKRENK